MAIQDFTAGQVLTALQMDNLQANDYNQTVSTKTASYTLVAADKGTRVVMNSASATTITVNTSLFSAGDTLVLQNISTGVCTITAGTATVSSAGSLAIPQNGSGTLYFTSAGVSIFYPSAVTTVAGGFTFVTGASFSAVSSVSLPNDTFTSTYDNYRMIFQISTSSLATNLSMRLRASGTDNTASQYESGFTGLGDDGVTITKTSASATSFLICSIEQYGHPAEIDLDIYNPDLAGVKTRIAGKAYSQNVGSVGFLNGGGGHFVDGAFDALTIIASAGTITGKYRIYGYANS